MNGTKIKFSISSQQNTIKVPEINHIKFQSFKRCPNCGSKKIKKISELKDSLSTSQCLNCSHMFHSRRPEKKWYKSWYAKSWDNQKKTKNIKKSLKQILIENFLIGKPAILGDNIGNFCSNHIKKGMKVLDIGCGNGDRIHHFKKFGAIVHGIEASEHRVRNAQKKKINVKNIEVNELNFKSFNTKFDFIYSSHVLEHVYNIHEYFEALERVLLPGGYFCIAVPNQNHDFLLANFLFALHLHFFSPTSLINICINYDLIPFKVFNEHQIIVFGQYKPKNLPKNYVLDLTKSYNKNILDHKSILNKVFEASTLEKIKNKKKIIWSNNSNKDFGFYSTYLNASKKSNNILNILSANSISQNHLFLEEENNKYTNFWVR